MTHSDEVMRWREYEADPRGVPPVRVCKECGVEVRSWFTWPICQRCWEDD